jgi:phosphatidate cytidylyltransferase
MGRSRRNSGSDLMQRIGVAIPAVIFAVTIIHYGGWVFAGGAALLGLVAMHELFEMYARVRPVRLAGFLGLIAIVVAAELGGERQMLLAAMAFFPVMFLVALVMPQGGPTVTARMSLTTLGVFWIAMPIAHAVLLRELPHGGGVIVTILVATFVGDTGAYLGGRAFGTRPLAPVVSPNKTVEGLLIGMLAAIFGAWAAGLYQDWLTHGQALLIGLSAAVMAPLGDLFESKVKRDAGTKDAGRLFGAHGGALDRLDAAFFTLVAGYYVWLQMI